MCAIVASWNKQKLKELLEQNSYRGSHSFSLSLFIREASELRLHITWRGLGKIDWSVYDRLCEGDIYYIAHVQAPTTEARDIQNVHPAEYQHNLLWHNGILKDDTIKLLQSKYESSDKWDTKLLLQHVVESGFSSLDNIDGGFSCIYAAPLFGVSTHNLYLFRNTICPMFYSHEDMTFSSTMFKNSKPTPPNTVFHLEPLRGSLDEIIKFKTKDDPFYFGD